MPIKIYPRRVNRHFIVASDWHSYFVHQASLDILKKMAIKLGKNKTSLIILGDFLDVPYLMKKSPDFNMWCNRADGLDEYFIPKLLEEAVIGNEILDQVVPLFEEVIFMAGNHEQRIDLFRESSSCPHAYKHIFDLKKILKFEERGIRYAPHNDFIDLGSNLSLTHGPSALKKHFEACGRSIIYGHVHTAEVKAFTTRGKTKKSWSLPTMGTLSPEYLKGIPNAWTNGFAHVVLKPNDHFQVQIHEVFDDELILSTGEVLRAIPKKD
jgi:predicted phosphodiesterase